MPWYTYVDWSWYKEWFKRQYKAICERFPKEFNRYIEVFGGAGWVLFNSSRHAELEVYNDINSNLVNLFRCVKYHPDAIAEEMALLLNSREIFNCFRNQSTEGMTDIQKAARYFYLIKASYGCKLDNFGAKPRKINRLDNILEIKQRLEAVVIENKGFDALINQYDKEDALFYCDPPYFGTENFYDTGDFKFDAEQHVKLKDILCDIKGKAIVSYNDCEFVRDLYKDFDIEEIERQNNLASRHGAGNVYRELIIRNY